MAYYLMADNRRRMPSSAYLRAELTEAHQAHQGYPPGAPMVLSVRMSCMKTHGRQQESAAALLFQGHLC